jgi:hypothetical protein
MRHDNLGRLNYRLSKAALDLNPIVARKRTGQRLAAGRLEIHFMRKVIDGIEYQRLEDGNLLIMKKHIGA